jgi:hypothetical protein
MSLLKNLQFSPVNAVICAFLALAALLAACAGNGAHPEARAITSASAAEKYAVSLANDRCEKAFGKRPFKTGRFAAVRSGDRWLWGWLDAAEAKGFTAQVSFHADHSRPEANVYAAAEDPYDMEAPIATPLNAPAPEAVPAAPEARPDSQAFTRQPEAN